MIKVSKYKDSPINNQYTVMIDILSILEIATIAVAGKTIIPLGTIRAVPRYLISSPNGS
ncbi:MAG: hypothetical protein QXD95_08190 [Nitrososphaeria archaeon]